MLEKRKSLGRGLNALLGDDDLSFEKIEQSAGNKPSGLVAVDLIALSPFQPRTEFDQDALKALAASIKEKGVLQPLLVRRMGQGYELIAGERRLRAAKIAGIKEVPVIEKDLTDKEVLEVALVENLLRENLSAIEEYAEVNQRYTFLKAQVEDVSRSENQLMSLISDLTATMRDQFTENFEKINRNFGRIFRELFDGGRASLELLGDDPLEAGIDIKVTPPGKIIKNLSLLSGGEQAFVAIAIYFAILDVRPAPFCLLDEIEAALDDVNVVKFASYIKKLGSKTQFIAITHRRGTMEYADTLYGVTMQEEGVSKVLQLDMTAIGKDMKMA